MVRWPARKPSRAVSFALSALVTAAWIYLRLGLFDEDVFPVTYVLPLIVCAWTCDTAALWAMAAAFAAAHTVHYFWLHPGGPWPAYAAAIVNVVVGASAVHLLVRLRLSLESALDRARSQAEELAGQGEELAQQGEELTEQNEELARQNEELQSQAEEIHALNDELAARERLLAGLLELARLSASEQEALEQVAGAARTLLGDAAAAVVVFESSGGALRARAGSGVRAPAAPLPSANHFAALAITQGRTAALADASLRPDLVLLGLPDAPEPKSALAAPLRREGQSFGAIAAYAWERREWTDEHYRLLEWLAAQAAGVLATLRLQERLRRHAALLDLSPDAIFVRAADGTIEHWTRGAAALYGWTAAEALGRRSHELLHTRFPRPLPEIEAELERAGCWSGRLVHRTRDGRELVVESRWLMERDGGGRAVLVSNIDVTERERAFEALQSSAAREQARAQELATVLDAVPAAVWIAEDPRGARISSNRFGLELLRLPEGANASRSAPEPDRPAHFRTLRDGVEIPPEELPVQRAARGEVVRDTEVEVVFDDGEARHLAGNAVPLFDAQGRPRGSVAAFVDVTRRRLAEDELRRADRRKNEFLATLSHELRNPLAPMRYAVDLLRRGGSGGDAAEPLRVLDRQLDQLVHLVNDLLDLTRIESDKIRLDRRPVTLDAVVAGALEAARPAVDAAGHRLEVSVPPGLWLDADPDRLVQAVTNLLNNAARYTPRGGAIRVDAGVAGHRARLSVSDTGVGLATEDLERVFEMFTQLGNPGNGGLGIGLALVRRVIELHGGAVRAHSDGPGRGARFELELPLADGPAAEPLPAGEPSAGAGGQAPAVAKRRGRRVLVVDDNADGVEMMRVLLELQGHEVCAAYDGGSALAALDGFEPEVALLDIGLPDMDGYELARLVRAHPRGGSARLVAVTGWGQGEDRARALQAGFDAHLTKPADPEALQRIVSAER